MPKDSSARYYQKSKESFQKNIKRYQDLSEDEKAGICMRTI